MMQRPCSICKKPKAHGYAVLGSGSHNMRHYCSECQTRVVKLCAMANMLNVPRSAGDACLLQKYADAWDESLSPDLFPHPSSFADGGGSGGGAK